MKKCFALAVLFAATAVYGQDAQKYSFVYKEQPQLPASLPDFSYYSRNYTSVFGEYQFNFDNVGYGTRNVYISDNNFYFNGSQNNPMPLLMNPCYAPDPLDSGVFIGGISLNLLEQLFNGDIFAKDYSPKNVDK